MVEIAGKPLDCFRRQVQAELAAAVENVFGGLCPFFPDKIVDFGTAEVTAEHLPQIVQRFSRA